MARLQAEMTNLPGAAAAHDRDDPSVGDHDDRLLYDTAGEDVDHPARRDDDAFGGGGGGEGRGHRRGDE